MVAMSRNCDMSVRVVSKCSLLQHDVAHFCALGRIIGQTEAVLISKDQKDRTVCVKTVCVINRNPWILSRSRAVNSQGTCKPTWLVWKHHIFSRHKWVAIICFLRNIYLGREVECMHNDNLFNIHDNERPIIVCLRDKICNTSWQSLLTSSVRSVCLWFGSDAAL